MDFRPDIFVVDPELWRNFLVVKATTSDAEPPRGVAQLKSYMNSNGCRVGLLVTPKRFRIFRHSFNSDSADAVTEIANFPTDLVIEIPPGELRESAFEDLVQGWLERLQAWQVRLPSEVRRPIEENIVAYLYPAEIRAAHPREQPVAT